MEELQHLKAIKDNDFKLIINYLDNENYRKSFIVLAKETFGLDFEPWYTKGYLRDHYIPYGWVKDGVVICNASLNFFTFIVQGEVKKGVQLGTVMTHPEFRKRGLALHLINKIVEDYQEQQDVIYLFANQNVLEFYPKAGFIRKPTTVFEVEAKQIEKRNGEIRKLSIEDGEDLILIRGLSENRVPLSKRLSVFQDVWPLQVYMTEMFCEDLYYIEKWQTIAIMTREQGIMKLMDVVSPKPVPLGEILSCLVQEEDEIIEIHFDVENLPYSIKVKEVWEDDDALFFLQGKELKGPIAFPNTSHT